MANTLTINIPNFRLQFPQFADPLLFSDISIQLYFDMATSYISDQNVGSLRDAARLLALYLMTAHLLVIFDGIANDRPVQAIQNAAEGTVNVGFVPPPAANGWQWWLSSTQYGQQLWALLLNKSVGGFYVGGAYVRSGMRRTNGGFIN